MSELNALLTRLTDYTKQHVKTSLFFGFLFLYFTVGLYLCFFNDIASSHFNIFFDMDTCHIYKIAKSNFYIPQGVYKHPFLLFVIKPFLLLTTAFVNSARAGSLFLQAILGSGVLCLIYAIIDKLTNRKKLALLSALIYGFSISSVIFSSMFELYIYTAFLNTLLFYYIILLWKKEGPLKYIDYFLLALLLISSVGITVITAVANLVLVFFLFKQKNSGIKNSLFFLAETIALYYLFLLITKLGNPDFLVTYVEKIELSFYKFDYDLNRLMIVLKSVFVHSFYGLKLQTGVIGKNFMGIFFANVQPRILYIPSLIFIFFAFAGLVKNIKATKSPLILPLILILVIHILECYIYDSEYCFLFSQNILPFLIVLMALLYEKFSDKFNVILCSLFLFWEYLCDLYILCIVGNYAYIRTVEFYQAETQRADFINYVFCSLFTVLIFGLIILMLKKTVLKDVLSLDAENKIKIFVLAAFVCMISTGVFTVIFNGRV